MDGLVKKKKNQTLHKLCIRYVIIYILKIKLRKMCGILNIGIVGYFYLLYILFIGKF